MPKAGDKMYGVSAIIRNRPMWFAGIDKVDDDHYRVLWTDKLPQAYCVPSKEIRDKLMSDIRDPDLDGNVPEFSATLAPVAFSFQSANQIELSND